MVYLTTNNIVFNIVAHVVSILISQMLGGSGVYTNVSIDMGSIISLVFLVVITVGSNYYYLRNKKVGSA